MKKPKVLREFIDLLMAFCYCQEGGLTARGAAGMAIAFLVAAVCMPIGLSYIYNTTLTNTTGWNAAVVTIFTVLFPLLFIVAVALKAFGKT